MSKPPICAAARNDIYKPGIVLPKGACDCHLHIFTDNAALVDDRLYTPPPALLSSYLDLQKSLGLERAVIVQPSVYGTDNTATLNAVVQGGKSFRAVVVVDPDTPSQALRAMHEQGARGVRINPMFAKSARTDGLTKLANNIAELGWHIQFLVDVSEVGDLEKLVADLPVPVVFDHFGHVPVKKGITNPGFQSLLRLVGDGRAWVKLSGAYRITAATKPPYSDVLPFAQAIVSANPEHLLWGSDWPHPHLSVPMPKDDEVIDHMLQWAPTDILQQRIFVDNPRRLYGFASD